MGIKNVLINLKSNANIIRDATMKNRDTFQYLQHTIEYIIGNPIDSYNKDYRIRYSLRIDNGDWIRIVGLIPVRLPDIKRAASKIINGLESK